MKNEKEFETMLAITVGMLLFYLWLDVITFLYLSLLVGILGLISSVVRKGIVFFWERFSLLLGHINGRILLSFLFFLLLTPIALLKKLFSKTVGYKNDVVKSFYKERNQEYKLQDMEKPW